MTEESKRKKSSVGSSVGAMVASAADASNKIVVLAGTSKGDSVGGYSSRKSSGAAAAGDVGAGVDDAACAAIKTTLRNWPGRLLTASYPANSV